MSVGGNGAIETGGRTVADRVESTLPFPADVVVYLVAGSFAVAGAVLTTNAEYGATSELLFGVFMNVGLPVVVIVGAAALRRSELPRETWWHVVTGYATGITFIAVLLLWSSLPELRTEESLFAFLAIREEFVLFGNLGGLFGFFIGVGRARSAYNRRLRRELEVSNELVESSREALWMFGDGFSELLYANAAFEEVLGHPRSALAADPSSFLEAVHPEDRAFVRERMRRLADGESLEYEMRVNPTEEYGRWVWVEAQPIYRDGEQVAVSGFARDITERKERRRRFEAIFNQTFQFTWLMAPDGTLLEVNDTALAFGGIDRESVVGEPIWETRWFQSSDSTRTRTREDVERAAPGEFVRHELEVQGADGTAVIDFSIRPVTDDDGEVTLLILEGREITELKDHEERLVSLHETTRRLFRADTRAGAAEVATSAARDVIGLPITGVWLYDEREDALVPAASSHDASVIFGEVPAFPRGEGVAWAVYESGEPRLVDATDDSDGADPTPPMQSELVIPMEGTGIFVVGSVEPDAFGDRQVSLAKLLATNVASAMERIDKQRELESRQRELEHQIERLDEFAGIVSHDLRNPLSVAKGHAQLLAEEEDLDAHPDLRKIDDALERMRRLIDDLLSLARAGEQIDELRPVPLDRVVRSAWNSVETDGADLRTHVDRRVRADESRLAQLFENLFRNAVEHGSTSPGSDTREDADEHAGDEPTITVGTLADGFYVEDDGPGIPADERADVFDAGYSTNDDGTGFGLSIVQEIADAHGWALEVTEGEDGGARFELRGVADAE